MDLRFWPNNRSQLLGFCFDDESLKALHLVLSCIRIVSDSKRYIWGVGYAKTGRIRGFSMRRAISGSLLLPEKLMHAC